MNEEELADFVDSLNDEQLCAFYIIMDNINDVVDENDDEEAVTDCLERLIRQRLASEKAEVLK